MTEATAPPVNPLATPPAPTPPATPAPTPTPPATPAPEPDDDRVDDDLAGLSPEHARRRANERLARNRDGWRQRATSAEQERDQLRQRVTALEAQGGSVAQLRRSLLESAIRSSAATLVTPEALEDAVRLIDTTDLAVGDDGKIDLAKVKAKVEEYVKARPYVAPGRGTEARPLTQVHQPGQQQGGKLSHAAFNDMVRQAAGRQ